MTLRQYLERLHKRLQQADLCYAHGTDNAWDEACYLVFASLGIDYESAEQELDRKLEPAEVERLDECADARIESRIPVAYLVGEAWFAGHRFKIDNRALIPRSPFAELIENQFEPLLRARPGRILDLCAGSGCIGIACALSFSEAEVDLADLSQDALALANQNIELHDLNGRVRTIRSDLFADLPERYDLIVCNPPYVGAAEYDALPAEFAHEPQLGLLSPDEGLQIPLQILAEAGEHLTEQGILIMEVGFSDHLLSARLPEVPFLWLDFEHGGQGIFMLTRKQLQDYRDAFET